MFSCNSIWLLTLARATPAASPAALGLGGRLDVGVEFEYLDFSENQPYTPKNLVRHTGEDPMKWPDDLFTP